MASLFPFLIFFTILAFISFSLASDTPSPKAFILPISKNETSLQYTTTIHLGVSNPPFAAVIDLGGRILWYDCTSYGSRSQHAISCHSSKCRNVPDSTCQGCQYLGQGCASDHDHICAAYAYNPFADSSLFSSLWEDRIFVYSTDGLRVLQPYMFHHFPLACTSLSFLDGLTGDSYGLVGLGRSKTALPVQLSSAFNLPKKFALCLPSSTREYPGSIFIGGGPYHFFPLVKDFANSLVTTPLITNPATTVTPHKGGLSDEYFIHVKSIKIDGKVVYFSPSLLVIDKNGFGGTKISTRNPYTVLHTSIYESLVSAFVKASARRKILQSVESVMPFSACFRRESIAQTMIGAMVPIIDLVLHGDNAVWRMYGSNLMVEAKKNVLCLGFVDGGSDAKTSIVLGGLQLENHLVEFDLDASVLGFSTSLLFQNTSCSVARVF